MSERETPLDPNPTSGGSAASPSPEADPADLPPPPPAATAVAAADDDDGGEETNEVSDMLARASITNTDADADGENAVAKAGTPNFAFNFDRTNGNDDDDDEDEDDEDEDEDGPHEDIMASLPPSIVKRVNKLKELNAEREKIMEEYMKERALLEKKFADKCKPLYECRTDVIEGKLDDEIASSGNDDDDDDNVDKGEEEDGDGKISGIPQFWAIALGHMEIVGELITEQDIDCLLHLRNVTCEDDADGRGFTLYFYFDASKNTYFTNEVLTKKYEIPNLLLEDEPILKDVQGCTIDWKEGMSLTYRDVKKKQRSKAGRNAGKIRTVTKRERQDSFFHFFQPPKIPTMEAMTEEEADGIEQAFDHDYDVAQAFRSHLIPKAVLWFTGEALDEIDDALLESALMDGPPGDAAAGMTNSPFPPPVAGENQEECKQN